MCSEQKQEKKRNEKKTSKRNREQEGVEDNEAEWTCLRNMSAGGHGIHSMNGKGRTIDAGSS